MPPPKRRIASGIPGAQLWILEGEGHGSYIVHKEKIGAIIQDFVTENSEDTADADRQEESHEAAE